VRVILAVDTSRRTAVAVVRDDGSPLTEASNDDPRAHAEAIGPLLAAALEGLDRGALTAVAYGIGPGPFTGLRVGIAAARAVAGALGLPVLPVASHDAVALQHLESGGRGGEGGGVHGFLVVTDAKRREVYATRYAGLDADRLPVRASEATVGPADALPPLPRVTEDVSAVALGRIAARRAALGRPADGLEPLYLRAPDVTLAAPKRVRP
jgi:tRNA threonylcarbamoyl adenosine modification protein YeaZ